MFDYPKIFQIKSRQEFDETALEIFRFQAKNNMVYQNFIKHLNIDIHKINTIEAIPFLPIQLYKTHKVVSTQPPYDLLFESSGTTGMQRSRHYVKNTLIYIESFTRGFEMFFGKISNYTILALLPSYLEQNHSSLIFMTRHLIEKTQSKDSGFYLHNQQELATKIQELEKQNKKTILLGVSYALLDFAEKYPIAMKNTIIMETGGMKGRRKEMIREELHRKLCESFGVGTICSEYGMTELLSQSYSKGNGIFYTPPWQKILIRDTEDPLTYLPKGKTGGINVIDLANVYSCSFIATQDLGKITRKGFEVSGRFDHSDIRGCNLLIM